MTETEKTARTGLPWNAGLNSGATQIRWQRDLFSGLHGCSFGWS